MLMLYNILLAKAVFGLSLDHNLKHLSSPSVFIGVRVTRSLFLCVFFIDRYLSFCTFFWAIVLSVLLRYTDSDYLPLLSSNSSCTGFNGKKVRIFFSYEPHMEIHLYVILNFISSILNLM